MPAPLPSPVAAVIALMACVLSVLRCVAGTARGFLPASLVESMVAQRSAMMRIP